MYTPWIKVKFTTDCMNYPSLIIDHVITKFWCIIVFIIKYFLILFIQQLACFTAAFTSLPSSISAKTQEQTRQAVVAQHTHTHNLVPRESSVWAVHPGLVHVNTQTNSCVFHQCHFHQETTLSIHCPQAMLRQYMPQMAANKINGSFYWNG